MRRFSISKKTEQLPSAMRSIRHCLASCYFRRYSSVAAVPLAVESVKKSPSNTITPHATSLASNTNDNNSKEPVTPFDQLASGGLAAPLSHLQYSSPELSINLFHTHLRQHHCNSQQHPTATSGTTASSPNNTGKHTGLPEWPIVVYNYALRAYLRAGRRADAYRLLALLETDPERKMAAGLAVNDATIELILSDLVLHTPRTKSFTATQSSSHPSSTPDRYQAEVYGAIGAVNMSRMVDDLFGRIRGKKSITAWTARLLAFCHSTYCSEHVVADNLPSPSSPPLPSLPLSSLSLGRWQTDEFKAYLEQSSEFVHRIRQFRDAFSDDLYALAAVIPRLMHACVKREIWPAVYYLLDIIQASGHMVPGDNTASMSEREALLLPTQSVFRILSIYTLPIWSSPTRSSLSPFLDSSPPHSVFAFSSKSSRPPKPSDDSTHLQSATNAVIGNTVLLTRQTCLVALPLVRYLWRRLPEDAISEAMAERWLVWAARMGTPLATDVALKCYQFLLQSSSSSTVPSSKESSASSGWAEALPGRWTREGKEETFTRRESARTCLHRSTPLDYYQHHQYHHPLDKKEDEGGKQDPNLCILFG